MRHIALLAAASLACAPLFASAQARRQTEAAAAAPKVAYISYAEARPILEAARDALPAELRSKTPNELESAWPGWVARRDAEIRSRLAQGDEDSLVNFLLFGVSFTRHPRATPRDVERLGEGKSIGEVVAARLDDLVAGIAAPGTNERLLFARGHFERRGVVPSTPEGRARTREMLIAAMQRVLAETTSHERAIESARLHGDPNREFATRSTLYRDRGLSSDTSVFPNVAVDRALAALAAKGLLAPNGVRRIAVVGPGLDYADKGEGFDFYPQQTIQPFAVVDSLVRLGLAARDGLRVTTLDLSPRINEHLAAARARAARGTGYTVQLVRDPGADWSPETARYWERFGEGIGSAAKPAPLPKGYESLEIRAVEVRPAVVSLVASQDLNVVLQRREGAGLDERFDLVIATNILVYYDVFEQSLALANVAAMLRPGGFLLSNNALLELPAIPMRSVGYETTVYSSRPGDGDHVVWYRREPDPSPAR